ncbi:recombinase family protein [Vibrio superstes]|nr:recombinase family protein [Vibrio superstes]
MRQFIYARVSKAELNIENQVEAFKSMGINTDRVISDEVSGSVPAMDRENFRMMIENQIESGDELHVLKLDRLGRDAIDVQMTVDKIASEGIKLFVHDLPVSDLSSTEGRLMLQMMASFAEFERNRIRERTMLGLERAKGEGKILGRPTGSKNYVAVQELKQQGMGQSEVARHLKLGRSTVVRNWAEK